MCLEWSRVTRLWKGAILCWEELTNARLFSECPWAQELLPAPMPSFPTGLLGSLLQGQESRIIHIHAGSVSPGVSVPTMKGLNQEYPSISMVARLTQEYPYP